MRGKSCLSKSRKSGVEIEKLEENPKEAHNSGAYIRSLVKQLTKDSSNPMEGEGVSSYRSSCDEFCDEKQENSAPPPQQHKKQVRRRLHTSRPYQERLLNMAEARREIVTALKYHRAAMKLASEKQKQQQRMESGSEIQPLQLEQEAKLKSRRNPRIYASNSPTNYLDNTSYSPGFCSPYSWSIPQPSVQESLDFALPTQTLGLNLNLEDFANLDATTFRCSSSTNPSSVFSSSSAASASTSSSPLSATTDENPPPPPLRFAASELVENGDSGLHTAMDDKEMAQIRSIGEQYQMEWNDTLNLVNSAWWFKFLNKKGQDFINSPFDEVVEFPSWINANESCLEQVNDYCSQDPALPCMDIEEIEGMDGDWLA